MAIHPPTFSWSKISGYRKPKPFTIMDKKKLKDLGSSGTQRRSYGNDFMARSHEHASWLLRRSKIFGIVNRKDVGDNTLPDYRKLCGRIYGLKNMLTCTNKSRSLKYGSNFFEGKVLYIVFHFSLSSLRRITEALHLYIVMSCYKPDREATMGNVFEIPGEPAIVINGVPDMTPSDNFHTQPDPAISKPELGFGEWVEGRKVRKLFEEQLYSGKVTNFDKKSGWYKVVYEDGDSEDLEWHELKGILIPLDINVPLKSLALKILKKNERTARKKTINTTPASATKKKIKRTR
ncbi:hypothetical protein GIB67_030369 [Kingdonia uniflora]|uniref:Tudor domain-containing protein n=1 Tax=Kingdonia uniflora TaxID=39325 RepID=A0A7J7M739_9MAGN|nr:hypothetical protein GIB67_030369 [Kingdonia uniflora]